MIGGKPHRDSDERAISEKGGGIWEFKSRAFNIVWGNDRRYWLIPSENESSLPAELRQVSWLEVTSSIRLPEGKYSISFKISMKSVASGWKGVSVYLMAKVGRRGEYKYKKLQPFDMCPKEPAVTVVPEEQFIIEIKKADGIEYMDRRVYFGLYEVWSGEWKKGLIMYGATIKRL